MGRRGIFSLYILTIETPPWLTIFSMLETQMITYNNNDVMPLNRNESNLVDTRAVLCQSGHSYGLHRFRLQSIHFWFKKAINPGHAVYVNFLSSLINSTHLSTQLLLC